MRESESSEHGAMIVAAALLPVVEQVAPDRLAGFLGRAILMRRPRGDQTARDEDAVARTIAMLSHAGRPVRSRTGRRMLRPLLEKHRVAGVGASART